MRRFILSILTLCAVYSIGELLYIHFVVFPEKRATKKKRRWEDMDPPAKYAEYCKRKDLQWTIGWQSCYMKGDLLELWEVNEKGDSILDNLIYRERWGDKSDLSSLDSARLERSRQLADEQWARIREKVKSGEIKLNKDVWQFSPEQ